MSRNMTFKLKFAKALTVVIVVALAAIQSSNAAEIEWKSEKFERVSVDENVQNVLRGILKQNGLEVVFRPGVEGTVTFEFSNLPLRAAFRKLIAENNLSYDYDDKTGLVTVFPASDTANTREFVPLRYASEQRIQAAIERFGLEGRVTVDKGTNTALIVGTQTQVTALKDLIQRMDDAEATREKAETDRQKRVIEESKFASKQRREAAAQRREAEKLKIEQEQLAARRDMKKLILERFLDQEIRVIPVRFANVGQTTKIFSGEQITIPGIDGTLRKLIGQTDETDQTISDSQKELAKRLREERPEIALDQPTISIDQRTNSVIVRGSRGAVARVEKLVRELDKPIPMVEIEVMIVRAADEVSENLGIDLAFEQNLAQTGQQGNSRFTGINTGVTNTSPDPSAVVSGLNGNATTGAVANIATTQSFVAGLVFQGTRGFLQAQLQALAQDNKTQTLAAPRAVTLNNVAAKIEQTASQFFAVTTNGETTDLEEVEAGLRIELLPTVIPAIDSDAPDLIRLSLTARNTALGAVNNGAAAASGQEITTEIVIPDGRTYVMGGVFNDTRTDNETGVPFFKDIPVLGQLFRNDNDTDNLNETLFFITPKIINPEEIKSRDIAERRYLDRRKNAVGQIRKDLQVNSRVSVNVVRTMAEDE